ncbi:MAG: nucleotidyltransferase family protein, partial [Kiloniellales bacterium]
MPSESEQQLCAWIAEDPWRMDCLAALAALALPDAWIGAGFVRNLAWDRLHGFAAATPLADVDVLIFDSAGGEA